jgi:hypothetical protein
MPDSDRHPADRHPADRHPVTPISVTPGPGATAPPEPAVSAPVMLDKAARAPLHQPSVSWPPATHAPAPAKTPAPALAEPEPEPAVPAARAQAHAPTANTTLQRLRQADWYLILLAVILGAVLTLLALTALAFRDLRDDITQAQATPPAVSAACTQATAQIIALSDAAKLTEGAGAHAQHEATEETLIHQAQTLKGACR